MNSLRLRLLLWLLPVTTVVVMLASVGSYWGATLALAGLLDEQLRYVAEHVSAGGEHIAVDRTNEPRRHLDDERADEVLTEVWQAGRLVFSSDRSVQLPPPVAAGIHDVLAVADPWHTFVLRRGDRTIRVAQAQDARWEALFRVAVHLVWPIVALIPLLGGGLWFGIGHGLRPLRQIAAELSRRDANGWSPIEPRPLPREVEPLVDALNGMLGRLERAFGMQGDFIADAAHELRTPTMALGVHAELAQQAIEPGQRDAALRQVRRGVERLERLSGQLLTLARVASGARSLAREPVDLAALCRSVIVDELASADARHQDLGLDAPAACGVTGHAISLQWLVRNLVDNAIRYSAQHGRIEVAVRPEAGGVRLVVQDDGPGIDPGQRLRVLDRFHRGAHPLETGSGLGLAIVKRIAEEHQAALVLEDAVGHCGLRVTVFFPSRVEDGAPASVIGDAAAAIDARPRPCRHRARPLPRRR